MAKAGKRSRPEPSAPTSSPPPDGALFGIVVRAYGLWFDVRLRNEDRILMSTVRGSVKRARRGTDLVAVGDRVWVVDVGEGEGQIVAIEPRVRSLARLARHTRDVEQVILANPDQALFLFARREPEPHLRMLDRFLILAESRDLPAIIGLNKIDDPARDLPEAQAFLADYADLYPIHYLSAATGYGIEELKADLKGKVTVVAGPSGVGKSSLLNRLDPDGERIIGEISDATGKGRHTTTSTILYEIGEQTFVADTPGIRALALQGVTPEQLPECYPELRPYLGDCFYSDCTHLHEPGCAILDALEAGEISSERYKSYASLRRGDTSD
ncbi:MAG: ribosome small subunit-dependent GTPase A [Thermomicrobiales bacterium]|nr:ribosome small subunit-dependent GTPase A [Thermomicrobiales bacterium]